MRADELVLAAERERIELDQYDAEGVALIRIKLAAIQRARVRLWRLAKQPHSKRNSLWAEEISLAYFQLGQLRYAMGILVEHLRKFREGRQREGLALALRYDARTAPKPNQPATCIAARPS
jgi:hypothetical protein